MNRRLLYVLVLLLCAAAFVVGQGVTDYSAWVTGAKIDYKGGRFAKAVAKFRNAVVQRPNSAEARYWLGLSLAQLGRESLVVAAAQFDSCFTLDSAFVTKARHEEEHTYLTTKALSATADAKMVTAEYADAARYSHWAIALEPDNPSYYMTLGNAYVGLDLADSIRIVARNLVQRDSGSAQAAFFMGIYYSKKERMDSALLSFKQAGVRYEVAIEKQKERLAALLKIKSPAEVDPIAARLTALRNDQAGLKKYIEEDLNAGKQIQQVAELTNNLYIDHFQISLAFHRAGMAAVQQAHAAADTLVEWSAFSLADTMFRHAVATDPENYDAIWYLGYVNYRLRRYDATAEVFRRAIVLSAKRKDLVADKDPELWLYMGTSEAQLKQYDSAVVHLRRAVNADPTDTVVYDNLAFVYKDMSKGDVSSPFTDSAVQVLDEKEVTGWKMMVWQVTPNADLGATKPLAGMEFVTVELTVFNKSGKADTVDPGFLTMITQDKKSYMVDPATSSPDLPDGLKAGMVDANKKLEAVVIFSVPKGAKPERLVLKPKSGNEVIVVLK